MFHLLSMGKTQPIYFYTAQKKSSWALQNYSVKQVSVAANGQACKSVVLIQNMSHSINCHFTLWHNSLFLLNNIQTSM